MPQKSLHMHHFLPRPGLWVAALPWKQRGAMVCLPCAVRAAPLSLHRSCKPHKLFLPNSCQLITPVLVHGSHFATCCAMSHAQAVITYETEVSF